MQLKYIEVKDVFSFSINILSINKLRMILHKLFLVLIFNVFCSPYDETYFNIKNLVKLLLCLNDIIVI